MNAACSMSLNSHSVKNLSRSTRELNFRSRHGENWRMTTAALLAERSKIEVGRRLLALRRALGLKAYEICAEVTVQSNTWSQWEKGKRMADLDAMMRIADRFGADLNYIYMGSLAGMPMELAGKVRAELDRTAPPPEPEIARLVDRALDRRERSIADQGEKKKAG